MSISSEAKQEVQRLLAAGNKIKAVKYLIDTFGISLADAKTLVEAVEAEGKVFRQPSSDTGIENDALRTEVFRLLQDNKKIEAIKLVKETRDMALIEAKTWVENIQQHVQPSFTARRSGPTVNDSPGFNLFAMVFGGVGLLLFIICGIIYAVQLETISASDKVTGMVTDFVYSGDLGAPVITFNWKGGTISHEGNTFSRPLAYDLGEKVELYVNREDPHDVVINSFSDRWLAITIVGGIGLLFSLFGLAFNAVGRTS